MKAAKIGAKFIELLKAELSPAQFAEMQNLNAVESRPNCCHSHDYCDANEVMAPAFAAVVGREINLQNEKDCELWSEAWNWAMVNGLGQDAAVEAAAANADARNPA